MMYALELLQEHVSDEAMLISKEIKPVAIAIID